MFLNNAQRLNMKHAFVAFIFYSLNIWNPSRIFQDPERNFTKKRHCLWDLLMFLQQKDKKLWEIPHLQHWTYSPCSRILGPGLMAFIINIKAGKVMFRWILLFVLFRVCLTDTALGLIDAAWWKRIWCDCVNKQVTCGGNAVHMKYQCSCKGYFNITFH